MHYLTVVYNSLFMCTVNDHYNWNLFLKKGKSYYCYKILHFMLKNSWQSYLFNVFKAIVAY